MEILEPAAVESHISRKTSEMPRISCTWHRTGLRVRLSLKERRIKFAEPTKLHRKSGIWGTQGPWSGQKVSHACLQAPLWRIPHAIFVRGSSERKAQGLKPKSLCILYGPTEVVP